MKKLLFASLLTVAVGFAQATGGTTSKSGPETMKKLGGSHGDDTPSEAKTHGKKGGKKASRENRQKPPKRPEAPPPGK